MLNRISLLLVLASRQRSKDRDRASAFQRFAGHFRAVPVIVLSDTKPEISGENFRQREARPNQRRGDAQDAASSFFSMTEVAAGADGRAADVANGLRSA